MRVRSLKYREWHTFNTPRRRFPELRQDLVHLVNIFAEFWESTHKAHSHSGPLGPLASEYEYWAWNRGLRLLKCRKRSILVSYSKSSVRQVISSSRKGESQIIQT